MATVTPNRPRDLAESRGRIRHPLQRVRSTIRLYVALEGAALLLTLLALWFWADLAFDYGLFAGLSFDWVQEVPRPVRAAFLGVLFLLAALVVHFRVVADRAGSEVRAIIKAAFATGGGRHELPVWLRLPLVALGVGATAWLVSFLSETAGLLAAAGVGALISGLHEIVGVRGRSSISVWLRAPIAAGGCAIGAVLGYQTGYALAQQAGAAVGAGLLAPLFDVVALTHLGMLALFFRGRSSIVALSVPALLVYVGIWALAGYSPELAAIQLLALIAVVGCFVLVWRRIPSFRGDALHSDMRALVGSIVYLAALGVLAALGWGLTLLLSGGSGLPTLASALLATLFIAPIALVILGWLITERRREAISSLLRFLAAFLAAGLVLGVLTRGLSAAVQSFSDGSESPRLAALVVCALMMAPVLYLVLRRLLHDFRDEAVALVLERRFPDVLGDRLISAVELADPRQAAQYGYSEPMIVATIHDAADRVDSVPVSQAFDWKRLARQWGVVLLLTLVLYIGAGAVFGTKALAGDGQTGVAAGFGRFHEVAGLWLERNVLLMNSIWPRQAHLEVLDWPEGDELKIGRDQAAPSLRVRALKWVIADTGSKEGWRALTWNDLAQRRDLLGTTVEANLIPESWGSPRNRDIGWTLDEIEARLEKQEVRTELPADTLLGIENVLDKLRARAAEPAMRRTLRMLKIPATVVVSYRGANTSGQMPFDRRGDNEYSGSFSDLKESIRFHVRGEDYYTRTLRITVVPTPSLVELTVDELLPAYMFYRVAGGKPEQLKGKKQVRRGRQVSLYGGDTSRIDPVAAGSDLALTARSDKELVSVRIAPPRKGVPEVKGEVELIDSRTFRVVFTNVRATAERPVYDFYFEFVDTDGVRGNRHIIIKPIDDAVPDVDISAEVVRKTSQGYMITPLARVPLRVKVNDDYGLDALEFAATYSKIDKGAEGGVRGLFAIGALHLVPGGPGLELAAAARLATVTREARAATARVEADAGIKKYPITPFQQLLASATVRREYQTLEQIDKQLAVKPPEFGLTKFYELIASERDSQREPEYFFNVERLGLKADETRDIQPRYRMQLWVEAVDNDIETGPHRGLSKEKLSFLVVSENELLSEIAKEEENLYTKLVERVNSLGEAMAKLDRVKEDLTAATLQPGQFESLDARANDVFQTTERAEGIITEVHTDYRRILQELLVNRVQQGMIDRVERQICDPLQGALEKDFPSVKNGINDLHKALTDTGDVATRTAASRKTVDEARDRMGALIRKLTGVLDQMKQLADINELIKKIREIEQQEVATGDVLKKLKDQLEGSLLDEITGGKKK